MSEKETAKERRRREAAEAKAVLTDRPETDAGEAGMGLSAGGGFVDDPEDDGEREEQFSPQTVAFGGSIAEREDEPEVPVAVLPETPFERFMRLLDPETRELLDEDDLRAIFDEQQAKAHAEKKAAAKKAAAASALQHARIEAGIIAPASAADLEWERRMDEPVTFTVDLPDIGDIGLRIDQKIYLHGVTYTVPRRMWDSMRSTMYQAQQAELLFEGKDKRHWLRRRARGTVSGFIEMVQ